MRTLGCLLLAAGIGGFIWSGQRLGELDPVPATTTLSEHFAHPAGRMEVLRYASACAAGIGLLLVFFPKGR